MALGSIQAVTEMSTKNISWGLKAVQGWQPYHLHVADCLEIWELQPPGTLKPVHACRGITLPFNIY